MESELLEGLWACAVIFVAIGGGVLVFYGIGILYRGIRDWFGNKGMIGKVVK